MRALPSFLLLLFSLILFSACSSHVRFTRSPEPVSSGRAVRQAPPADTAVVLPPPSGESPGVGKGLPAPDEAAAPAPAAESETDGSLRPFQEGEASYYAHQFHGRTTANGERFDMHALTAAHRKLPFNTRVKVVNSENDRSVVVRINDRGPFAKDRIIDLSMAAARAIDLVRKGTGSVKLYLMETKE